MFDSIAFVTECEDSASNNDRTVFAVRITAVAVRFSNFPNDLSVFPKDFSDFPKGISESAV